VAFAKATHEKYGFQDFKLKGGVLPGNEEMDVIRELKKAFPGSKNRPRSERRLGCWKRLLSM